MDPSTMDPATTPGMAPPPGEKSVFNGPFTSLQIGTMIAFGVTYFFATLFLGLRYLQAIKISKKVELDMILVTLSYGASMYYFISMFILMHHGWGRHLWDVSLANLVEFNKALLPNTMTYLICPSVTKLGMLAVLYRISPSRIYRAATAAVALAVFGYTLALCTITGGPCNPTKEGTTKCLENVALSHACLNIASDFAVIAVPIPTIHSLQLSIKQKLQVGLILGLGSAVVICSIARVPYVLQLDNASDITYTEGILGLWSVVEINIAIICACAMRLKSLVVAYFPRLGIFTSRTRTMDSNSWGDRHQINRSKGQRTYQLHSVQKGCSEPSTYSADIHGAHGSEPSSRREDY